MWALASSFFQHHPPVYRITMYRLALRAATARTARCQFSSYKCAKPLRVHPLPQNTLSPSPRTFAATGLKHSDLTFGAAKEIFPEDKRCMRGNLLCLDFGPLRYLTLPHIK